MSTPLQQMQALLSELGYPSAGNTNVPTINWTPTGLQIPTQAAILAGVLLDMNAAFGGNLNPAYSTGQGQWASSQAAAIANCYALIAQVVNGMDPDQNSGFMQDMIGRIYFKNRVAGTPTLVTCTCVGLNGTLIPAGALAQDTAGNTYSCVNGGIIPIGGSVTLVFANVVNGPISCGAGTLTTIYQSVSGWESITNPAAGEPGTLVQSAESYEYTREASIEGNSQGSTGAVRGAVLALTGVTDCYVYENNTNSAVLVGSTDVSVPANGIFVGVIGGTSSEIAQAIFTKKSPGCPMAGNTSVTVSDPAYAGLSSQPSYTITFNNNSENVVSYNLVVNVKSSSSYPSSIVSDIQTACQQAFLGTYVVPGQSVSNTPPVRVAELLLASQFTYPVQTCEGAQIPVNVLSIYIGSAFVGTGTVSSGSNVLTIAAVTSGAVSAGSPVTDADGYIPAGSYIVQQLTGTTGGAGTYQLSQNATNTSSSQIITCTATGLSAQIGIDQSPVLGTVTVNLVA